MFDSTTTGSRARGGGDERETEKLSTFNWLNEGGMGRRGCWEAGFDAFIELNCRKPTEGSVCLM